MIGLGIAIVAAILVLEAAPSWLAGISRGVAAYDVASAGFLIVMWTIALHTDATLTAKRAAVEDPGRNLVLAVALVSVAAGIVAAVAILGRGPHVATGSEKAITYALAIGAVALGWLVIHTIFTLRYAHLYYYDDNDDNEADRGLKFPGTDNPNDLDFAYFAFVVGMTYQVSDVQVCDGKLRRLVLFHGLVSFVYSTMIVALAINIVSGLIH